MSTPSVRAPGIAALLVALITPGMAAAQTTGRVTADAGLTIVRFATPEGTITAYVPDDVAPGEHFSGTLAGPAGFVLALGEQQARTGKGFHWRAPAGAVHRRLLLVLRDADGQPRARAYVPLTTNVTVDSAPGVLVAESHRKVIVRAPQAITGPVPCTLLEGRTRAAAPVRGISIDVSAGEPPTGEHTVTIAGLAGFVQDVPLDIGGNSFYVRAAEIPSSGTFRIARSFRAAMPDLAARLVIPQSSRDEVAVLLRTPQRTSDVSRARQHGDALRLLDFDGFPAAVDLLGDFELGGSAAEAILAADEPRALRLIFESMPKSGLSTQMLGFTWFLDHQTSSRPAAAAALDAARRVLRRVLSTATAELALYVIAFTGNDADFPLLQRFYGSGWAVDNALRAASEVALVRLGSVAHLDTLRRTLAQPLDVGASYQQAGRVARLLRTAGLSGRQELVGVVCGHVSDRVVRDIEYAVDPSRNAVAALSALIDGTNAAAANASLRSREEWVAYCEVQGKR